MTTPIHATSLAILSEMADDVRWNAWQVRGRAERVQTTQRLRIVAALIALGLAGWLMAAIRALA